MRRRCEGTTSGALSNRFADLLEVASLDGRRFLDVGWGSGIFSLAARRLGAVVHSFDVDEESVEFTRALKLKYAPDDPAWTVERGSVLDDDYLGSARYVRRSLFVGRPAPHRGPVGGDGQRRGPCGTRRPVVRRRLQQSGVGEPIMADGKARLRRPAPAPSVRRVLAGVRPAVGAYSSSGMPSTATRSRAGACVRANAACHRASTPGTGWGDIRLPWPRQPASSTSAGREDSGSSGSCPGQASGAMSSSSRDVRLTD